MPTDPSPREKKPTSPSIDHLDEYDVTEDVVDLTSGAGPAEPKLAPDAPAAPAAAPSAAVWYTARPGSKQEGPFTLEVLRQRFASGALPNNALAWRAGMPVWVPANKIPELSRPASAGPAPSATATPPVPPLAQPTNQSAAPPPFEAEPEKDERDSDDWSALPPKVESMLAGPKFYRLVGRTAAPMAGLFALLYFVPFIGYRDFWMTWALIAAVVFLIGEAASRILERLEAIEARLTEEEEE